MKLAELALVWLHPELAELPASPFELAARHADAAELLVRGAEVRPVARGEGGRDGGIRLSPLRSARDVDEALALARAGRADHGARPIPFFAGAELRGERATRLGACWRGLLPGDVYPAPLREATRELVRLLFPERALLFRTLEHYALAGIDLAAAAQPPPCEPATRGGARIVALEGIDGAGKSTHLAALAEHLRERGLACAAFKIFRHGLFHRTVTDLVRRCHGERDLHLWRLERIAKAGDSLKCFHAVVAPALERLDVALFDRYVPTHVAAATGRLHHDACTRALLSPYPLPARVFLLDLPAGAALARIGARGARTIDENVFMLERYRARLAVLAEREGYVVLDAQRPFEENQAAMRADLERLLERRAP